MSTVGLTDARRSALALLADCRNADDFALALQAVGRTMLRALHADKLIDDEGRPTKRGHAALAAPRMTQAEYDTLREMDNFARVTMSKDHNAIIDRGWVSGEVMYGETWAFLTPAGRTALNNVRAALGSGNYKENMT